MDYIDLVCLRVIAGISDRDDIDTVLGQFTLDNSATTNDIRNAACEHIAQRLSNLDDAVQYAHERAK